MSDVILDYILFNTLSSPSTFFIICDISIHLRLKTNEFSDRDATSFILEFSNDFFINIAIIWRDKKMRLLAQTTTFQPLLWRANAVDEN